MFTFKTNRIIDFITNIIHIIFVVILFGNSQLFSLSNQEPQNEKNLTDSLIIELNLQLSDTAKIDILLDLAWHLAVTNSEESIRYADSAIFISEKFDLIQKKARALNNKGEALRSKGLFEKSIKCYKSALAIFKELGDLKNTARVESEMGIAYFNLSDYENSYKHFDEALVIYTLLNDQESIVNVHSYLGVVFSHFGYHENAIEYFQKAIEIARLLNNNSKVGTHLNNLGLTYVELKEYEKAIDKYEESIQIFKDLGDEFNYSISLGNVGIPYSELKMYTKADNAFKESLEIALKLDDQYGLAHQYGNLGELYYKMAIDPVFKLEGANSKSVIKSSIKYLNLSIASFSELGAIEDQKDYLLILSDVNILLDNYKGALIAFKNAKALQDSIQSIANKKIVAGLEIKQELEKKQQRIDILHKEGQYQTTISNILMFSVLIVIFGAIAITFFLFKHRKQNKLLQRSMELRAKVEQSLRDNQNKLKLYQDQLEHKVKSRTIELEKEIEEHKITESNLLLAVERSEVASKAKSVFLANMSHELRTPLVGILGYSDLLTNVIEEEDVREMAEGINRTGNRLLSTLSLVLDLARIESDKYEIDITPVDIITELKETQANFMAMAKKKNININLDIHTDSFIHLTDAAMLKVILDNLVNNAIKFTHGGEINIISNIENNNGSAQLCIAISDTGVGIRKEEIPLIFEEFKQLSEGFTKDFQGSGLGLSITKKFIDLLGGSIIVESELGKGSTFKILFPTDIKAVA